MTAAETERADALTNAILTLASQLNAGEGFTCRSFVLAKTKAGKLRAGFGDGWYAWFRGDTEQLLREHLHMSLEWRTQGYFARDTRIACESLLANPRAYACTNIGRDSFRFARQPGRKLIPQTA
jgi:hypothetical protein